MNLKTLLPCTLASFVAFGCGGDEPKVTRTVNSTGAWTVFANPFGDGQANPAQNIAGNAVAEELEDGTTRVTLIISGVTASHEFGAHVHKLACDDNKGGGHYQNNAFTTTANDPAFANPTNEVWLDVHTDSSGGGTSTAVVSWKIRAGEAKSVVVHSEHTTEGGIAGVKLACISLPL